MNDRDRVAEAAERQAWDEGRADEVMERERYERARKARRLHRAAHADALKGDCVWLVTRDHDCVRATSCGVHGMTAQTARSFARSILDAADHIDLQQQEGPQHG